MFSNDIFPNIVLWDIVNIRIRDRAFFPQKARSRNGERRKPRITFIESQTCFFFLLSSTNSFVLRWKGIIVFIICSWPISSFFSIYKTDSEQKTLSELGIIVITYYNDSTFDIIKNKWFFSSSRHQSNNIENPPGIRCKIKYSCEILQWSTRADKHTLLQIICHFHVN